MDENLTSKQTGNPYLIVDIGSICTEVNAENAVKAINVYADLCGTTIKTPLFEKATAAMTLGEAIQFFNHVSLEDGDKIKSVFRCHKLYKEGENKYYSTIFSEVNKFDIRPSSNGFPDNYGYTIINNINS